MLQRWVKLHVREISLQFVYNKNQEAIFLFGGFCSESKQRLNDLWKFQNGQWQEISSSQKPEARSGHSLVYDTNGDQLILFGGKNDAGDFLADTWSWNGSDWLLISKNGPEPRQSHRIIYSESGIVLFGGANDEGKSLADTWIFAEGK